MPGPSSALRSAKKALGPRPTKGTKGSREWMKKASELSRKSKEDRETKKKKRPTGPGSRAWQIAQAQKKKASSHAKTPAKKKPAAKRKTSGGRSQAWFDAMSKKAQAAYLKKHPGSKFAKGGRKAAAKATAPKGKKLKATGKPGKNDDYSTKGNWTINKGPKSKEGTKAVATSLSKSGTHKDFDVVMKGGKWVKAEKKTKTATHGKSGKFTKKAVGKKPSAKTDKKKTKQNDRINNLLKGKAKDKRPLSLKKAIKNSGMTEKQAKYFGKKKKAK